MKLSTTSRASQGKRLYRPQRALGLSMGTLTCSRHLRTPGRVGYFREADLSLPKKEDRALHPEMASGRCAMFVLDMAKR